MSALRTQPRVYKRDGQHELRINLELPGAIERLRTARELLATLGMRKTARAQQ